MADKHSSAVESVTDEPVEDEALPGQWPHRLYDTPTAASVEQAREQTRKRVSDLRSLLGKYVNRHLPPEQQHTAPPPEPPRVVGAHARLLPFLQLIPWLLTALFGLSFLWDFSGLAITAFGYTLPLEGLLRVVSVSGLIGFLTNWLAVTMLFQPREERPIFGQGLIPAQRERVIFRLAQAVSEDLINAEIIKEKIERSGIIPRYREQVFQVTTDVIEDPDFRRDLKRLASDYVQEVLRSEAVQQRIVNFTIERLEHHAEKGLGGLALKAYRFLNEEDFRRRIDEAVRELPYSVDAVLDEMDHLLDRLPALMNARSEEVEELATAAILRFVEKLDVYEMVVTNMAKYDERELEALLKRTSNEQLNYIKYLGGVLGFFGGFVIWNAPLALIIFGCVGLLLYTIDELLFRFR